MGFHSKSNVKKVILRVKAKPQEVLISKVQVSMSKVLVHGVTISMACLCTVSGKVFVSVSEKTMSACYFTVSDLNHG